MVILNELADQLSVQVNVKCALHGQIPFAAIRFAGWFAMGKSNFIEMPSVWITRKTLPNWQVDLPLSNSTMNRKPVPEVKAKDRWVTPRFFRVVLINSPICSVVSLIIPSRLA